MYAADFELKIPTCIMLYSCILLRNASDMMTVTV